MLVNFLTYDNLNVLKFKKTCFWLCYWWKQF